MWCWRRGARTPLQCSRTQMTQKYPPDVAIEREVAENTPAGEPVGDPVVAADAEGDVLTYSLRATGDDDSFAIDRATGQLWTKSPLNVEADPTYMVEVTATDPSFTDGDRQRHDHGDNYGHQRGRTAENYRGSCRHKPPGEWLPMLDTDVYTADIQSATYTAEDDEGGDRQPAHVDVVGSRQRQVHIH